MSSVELLTAGEVAAMLRCHIESVRDWSKVGRIPAPIQIGRQSLWPKSEIESFLERQIEEARGRAKTAS